MSTITSSTPNMPLGIPIILMFFKYKKSKKQDFYNAD